MIEIDARGMRCPWPAIRLARALRDGDDDIRIRADDPAAGGELARVAAAASAVISSDAEGLFTIRRGTR